MKVGCYCRVSTDKDAQLDSLDNQVEFFTSLCQERGYELYRIYADEGISGRQTMKRKEFLKMMSDARAKKIDAILVKDVSRLARNTVDFLVTIRELKDLGVNVYFVTYGMDIKDSDETYLTMLAAIAQDESAKLSVRVKMAKDLSAKKGRVPNFVFGYDRLDRYTLVPNSVEAQVVREIFDMYVNKGMGVLKIAQELNRRGVKTKKNKQEWSGVVVRQILQNQIYIGVRYKA
jgi:site-specific DNA recombinase